MGIGTGDVIGLTKAELRKFLALSRDEKREVIEAMSPEALARWDGDFDWWAHRALQTLSPEYRAVITLRHIANCSYREASEILGIPEKTVKSRLFSARQLLREELRARGFGGGA